jgi:hypothetical protein
MSERLICTKISRLLILSQGESYWSILKLLTAEAYETYFIRSIFIGISKFLKLITLDYQDRLNLINLYTILLNISTKYALCNKLNTPLTYSTLVSINSNMWEFHQYISRYKLKDIIS